MPTTLTTNTSTRAPAKVTTTSSTQSSYSSTTQKTIEIRTTNSSDINKLADYIRRSVSKTFSSAGQEREGSFTPSQRTEGESRYSRSVSRSVYDGDDRYSKAEFSDSENNDRDDVIVEENDAIVHEDDEHFKSFTTSNLAQASFCRKLPIPKEFGGWFGVLLLMLIIPILVCYLQYSCALEKCEFKYPNIRGLVNKNFWITDVFDGEAVGAYLSFNFAIFVLSAFLFGRGVRLPGSVEYKFNALPMSIIFLLAFGVAEYLKYPVADFVIKNYLRFGIYGLLNAYVVALWAYIRSDMLRQKDSAVYNVYAKSGNFLIDYALGRQLNPKWLGLVEFKQVFYKTSLLSTFMYAVCLIYKNVQLPWLPKDHVGGGFDAIVYFVKHLKYDATALLCATMLLIYVLDSIVFEHHLASSFELQGEGFGCLLLLRYAVTPYLLSAVAKYFYEHRSPFNCLFSAYVPLLVMSLGLILKRWSNAIKYKYRIQPNHPHFHNIETIHTFQGKRLLLGSIWGRVRQPNYLGDIIALIGLGLPLAIRFTWPPFLCLLLIVVLLIHRCFRVNARNTSRYHSSWVRYRSIVRNYLVPNIF